jgi:regulator of replication initiation timing
MSGSKADDLESLPRETLIENLQIVKEHVPKIIDEKRALEHENEGLKQALQQKEAEIEALKAQLAAKGSEKNQ